MFGFNWVDIITIGLLVCIVVQGVRVGVVTQLLVIAAFFGTLFLAGWLLPHIFTPQGHTLRAIVMGNVGLLFATYAALGAYKIGKNIHWSFRLKKLPYNRPYKYIEMALGAVPALSAGLVLVWLGGVGLGRLPFEGFSNSVNDAYVVQHLVRALPPVPGVLAELERQVDPNSLPSVLAQPKPYGTFNYSADQAQQAALRGAASVVRITSFGCGSWVSGSGFVVGPDLVATNAHVIAGVKRPIIKYNGQSYEGVPVVFKPNLDITILRVHNLGAPFLTLASDEVIVGRTVAALGYPGGDYQAAPGIIRDTLAVSVASIYDQGSFGRGVYVIQTTVDYGSSGGPVVLSNGQVAAIIFSKPNNRPGYAYAITAANLRSVLQQALVSHQRVSSGACVAD